MTDSPSADQLLAAVAQWLRDEAMPQLAGATAYQARVAAGLLDTVARQLALGPAADAAEADRLHALLGQPDAALPLADLNQRLADAIAAGQLGLRTPGLAAHLWATSRTKLAIDQPRYDGLHRPPEPPPPDAA